MRGLDLRIHLLRKYLASQKVFLPDGSPGQAKRSVGRCQTRMTGGSIGCPLHNGIQGGPPDQPFSLRLSSCILQMMIIIACISNFNL
jgi:hypothetical protein